MARHPTTDMTGPPENEPRPDAQITAADGPSVQRPEGRRFAAPPVNEDRIVHKPISRWQAENPRDFQIQQVKRRFSAEEKAEDGGTTLVFQMVPSDPDFPFEMTKLECVLHVPVAYPGHGWPYLQVKNAEMGRGYQINVERGFGDLAEKFSKATLLELMKKLDKQLESFLTAPKAETVKLIPNAPVVRTVKGFEGTPIVPAARPAETATALAEEPSAPPTSTPEQRRVAKDRRAAETRQLETRLGRLPRFSKSPDGLAYTVPIEPRQPGDLPVPLQAVKAVKLHVPMLYPLEPCAIELLGVTRDAAELTEKGFMRRAQDSSGTSLMGQMNYLTQQMHVLAVQPVEKPLVDEPERTNVMNAVDERSEHRYPAREPPPGDDRGHIKIIPRPPEWALTGDQENEDSDDSDSSDSGDDDTDQAEDAADPTPEPARTAPERGILLSFPFLELHGVELLELVSVCLTIKCDRCKTTMDVSSIRHGARADGSDARSESCKKCANPLRIGTRTAAEL